MRMKPELMQMMLEFIRDDQKKGRIRRRCDNKNYDLPPDTKDLLRQATDLRGDESPSAILNPRATNSLFKNYQNGFANILLSPLLQREYLGSFPEGNPKLMELAARLLEKYPSMDEKNDLFLPPEDEAEWKKKQAEIRERERVEFQELLNDKAAGKIRFIMSMDMGCGNSSLAIWKCSEDRSPQLIPLDRDDVVPGGIPTIVGCDEDGKNLVIGKKKAEEQVYACQDFKRLIHPRGFGASSLDEGEIYPSAVDGRIPNDAPPVLTLRQVWGTFIGQAFECALEFLQNNENFQAANKDISRDNTVFVVAHPSSEKWSKVDVVDLYKEMIHESTGLPKHRILTFSEAKGAMQYFKDKENDNFDFSEGVLIVDLGASTIDLEYLCDQLEKPLEYSLAMAGQQADALLMQYILSQRFQQEVDGKSIDWMPDQAFYMNHQILATPFSFKWEVKDLKERISNDSVGGSNTTKRFGVEGFNVEVSTQDLISRLSEREFPVNYTDVGIAEWKKASWYGHLANLVKYALKDIHNRNRRYPLGKVIVTGGSSRLPEIQDRIYAAIEETDYRGLGRENIRVFSNTVDYMRCVPVGTAKYIKKLWKSLDLMQVFPSLLYSQLRWDLQTHCDKIVDRVWDRVKELIQKRLDWWASPDREKKDTSIKALKGYLNDDINNLEKDETLKDLSEKGIEDMKEDMKKDVVTILKDSMALINGFLARLAEKTYNEEIPLDLRDFKPSAAQINKAVKNVITTGVIRDNLTFRDKISNYIAGFLTGKKIEMDTPISNGTRRKVKENFIKDYGDEIIASIRFSIGRALAEHYDKKNAYNIDQSIIHNLIRHVCMALYIK